MTRRSNRSIATRRMRGKRPIASIESIESIDRVDRSVECGMAPLGRVRCDATTDASATGPRALVVDVGRGGGGGDATRRDATRRAGGTF